VQYVPSHVHLTTQAVDDWVRFYVDGFGAKVIGTMDSFGTRMVNLEVGGLSIRISNATGVEQAAAGEGEVPVLPPEGYHHFGFLVDDLDAAVGDLVAKGAEVEVPPTNATPTMRTAFLRLPGGVRVELCQ